MPLPDRNVSRTTKTFNTALLSATALQQEVMGYAQQLTRRTLRKAIEHLASNSIVKMPRAVFDRWDEAAWSA